MAVTYPHLLVFKEKHGDFFYHISCKEDRIKVFTQVFNERDQAGYWYFYDEKPTYEEHEKLETASKSLQAAVNQINNDIDRRNRAKKLEEEMYDLYWGAKGGLELALIDFMHARRDYEYEEWQEEVYREIK